MNLSTSILASLTIISVFCSCGSGRFSIGPVKNGSDQTLKLSSSTLDAESQETTALAASVESESKLEAAAHSTVDANDSDNCWIIFSMGWLGWSLTADKVVPSKIAFLPPGDPFASFGGSGEKTQYIFPTGEPQNIRELLPEYVKNYFPTVGGERRSGSVLATPGVKFELLDGNGQLIYAANGPHFLWSDIVGAKPIRSTQWWFDKYIDYSPWLSKFLKEVEYLPSQLDAFDFWRTTTIQVSRIEGTSCS